MKNLLLIPAIIFFFHKSNQPTESHFLDDTKHVKEWNYQVKITSNYQRNEQNGFKYSVDLLANSKGSIADLRMPAGTHSAWPMTAANDAFNPLSGVRQENAIEYKETTVEPGAGSALSPGFTEVCTATNPKISVALGCLPQKRIYAIEINIYPNKLACTGSETASKDAPGITLNIPPQKLLTLNLKGKEKIVYEEKEYTVEWLFTVSRRD